MSSVMDRISGRARPQFVPVIVGVVILLIGGVVLGQFNSENQQKPTACGQRVPVKVISSTEKSDWLAQLSYAYNTAARPPGTTCAAITVAGVTSGAAEQILAGIQDSSITDAQRAEMDGALAWTPSSRLWLDRLGQDDPAQALDPATVKSLAESQLVLAMPQPLAEKLHWDQAPPTWPEAFKALRDGKANYEQDSPRASTSGALASYLTFGAGTADAGYVHLAGLTEDRVADPKVTAFVRGVQGAAKGGFVNDSTDLLSEWAQRASLPDDTLLLVQDQMAWGYNNGQYNVPAGTLPQVPLVVVQPRTAGSSTPESVVADHPYVTLPGASARQQAAAADFFSYLTSHWDTFCRAGFHDSAGRPPAKECRTSAIPASVGNTDLSRNFNTLSLPAPAVQKRMVDQWMGMRSPRRILIAMDVSGSMQKKRLTEAVQAVKSGISLLRPQDEVQVIQFAGTKSFGRPHWTVLPLRRADSLTRSDTARLDSRPLPAQRQQTSVLDTADYAYQQMAALASPSEADAPVDAVIVLSDGINEWKGRATARSVCDSWKSLPYVRVDTVHYEPDSTEHYRKDQRKKGEAVLRDLANCLSPQGLALRSDSANPLNTVFRQVMGAL